MVADNLPDELKQYAQGLDKKQLHKLFTTLAEKYPDKYMDVLHGIADVGRAAVWTEGVSVSLAALRKSKAKEALLDPVRARVNEIMADDSLTDEQRRQVIVDTILPVAMKISDDVYKEAESENNPYITQIASGARGNKGGFNSIKGADLLVADQNDNFMPVVLDRSYSEGFTPAQYFAASYGQRKGMLDVKLSVGQAGYLSKRIVNGTHRQVITHDAPSPTRLPTGLPVDVKDKDNVGAVLAKDVGEYKAGTILTAKDLAKLEDAGIDEILVHSPLTEYTEDGGISALSAGRRQKAGLHQIGDQVGIAAAQAIGEKLSQGLLSCLVGKTLVRMSDYSTKFIRDIKPGDYVLGADKNGNTFPVKVNHLFDNGVQPCYRYEFSNGKNSQLILEATAAHKILGMTNFTNHSLDYLNGIIRKFPVGTVNRDMRCLLEAGLINDSHLTEEPMAYLLGFLLGDGCYTNNVNGVHFSCADSILSANLAEYLAQFNLSWTKLTTKYYYRISQLELKANLQGSDGRFVAGSVNNPAKQLLVKYGCYGKYAHEKEIPSEVLNWNNCSVAELVSGLIDTDGCIQVRKTRGRIDGVVISYATTSKPMLDRFRYLLETRFGVYGHLHLRSHEKSNVGKHDLYTLVISNSESIRRLANVLKLKGIKKTRLEDALKHCPPIRFYPNSAKRVKTDPIGNKHVYDIEVDHEDHLFVLANGMIVSNSKHSAGVGTRVKRQGFDYVNKLIEMPEEFEEAGPLSDEDGIVSEVRKAPQGGHFIKVGEKEYYAHPDTNPIVKVGDHVESGDDLTDGVPHPQQLIRLRGIGEARRVLTNLFKEGLDNSGAGAHRRNVESVMAGLVNWAEINDPNGFNDSIYGDVVPFGKIASSYKPRSDALEDDVSKSVGKFLEEPVLHYTPGTRITKKVADKLKKFGVNKAFVHASPPPFVPRPMRSINSVSYDPDWRTQLGGFYTSAAFERSLHRGATSDAAGTSYVPAIAKPDQFGNPLSQTGKYASSH
jgi:hypothetical protein